MVRRALKCHKAKENNKGIKSILGRIALLESAAREGPSNEATFQKMPEVRALCVQTVYVGEMHSRKRER